jgi:hypothetical protein
MSRLQCDGVRDVRGSDPEVPMSNFFSLEQLQQQADAAPGATRTPSTLAPDASPTHAAPVATPAPPAASDAQYVNLEQWRPGPDASAPDTAAANADDAKWEARYHALKGKYDAEVPRLSEEVRTLKGQAGQGGGMDTAAELQLLRDLTQRQAQELDTLKQASTTGTARDPAAATGMGDLSDDDLAFEFGENGAKAIRALLTKVDGLQQQVTEQVKPLETRLTQSEAQGFRERLAQRLGTAQSVFQDSEWASFVFQPMPFGGGKTFNQALQEADARRDIDGIVEIVQAFQQRKAPPADRTASSSALDALAVPDRIHAGGAPAAGQRFRSGDMESMMGLWQRGQKTFQELQQFERAFQQALREGRVDP